MLIISQNVVATYKLEAG